MFNSFPVEYFKAVKTFWSYLASYPQASKAELGLRLKQYLGLNQDGHYDEVKAVIPTQDYCR